MSTTASRIPEVEDFRRRLKSAISGLPRPERDRLLEQIGAHLEEAISATSTEAEVREVLDDLGTPEAIARATGSPPSAPRHPPYHEFIALVLLTVGSVFLPLLGWVIGVVLVWTSDRWSLAQKWLATLVWPGGVGVVLWLSGWATSGQSCSSVRQLVPNQLGKPVSSSCTSTGRFGWPAQVLAIVLLVAPVLVALYLGLRIQDRDVV